MATNLSKSHFHDCGKNPPRQRVVHVNGVRRVERIPNGKVEQWVRSDGNVVWVQMRPPGMPPIQAKLDARRANLRRRGWFEMRFCPLDSGALKRNEFPHALQEPCEEHGVHGNDGVCPHVKYAIDKRKTVNIEETQRRHTSMRAKENARKEAELRKEAEQRQLNQNILRLAELAAGVAGARAENLPVTGTPAATSLASTSIDGDDVGMPAASSSTLPASTPPAPTTTSSRRGRGRHDDGE